MKKRIEAINNYLKKIGSLFRTDDGLTLVRFNGCSAGTMIFIRRCFPSIDAMEKFVYSVKIEAV